MQGISKSTTKFQHFDNAAANLGRTRVAEDVDQLDGAQGIDGSLLKTQVFSCKSSKTQTFSNTMSDSKNLANDATNLHSTFVQLKMIEPQLQHNTKFQSTSLWPP